ncbi:alpha/beta hydrolase [Ktedonobacter sp. SOSP1-85]|uniref:alpha/beta hydrolase family protein n=1 Tax=Ktedonobacter sp. SOSP1-85 TaxID=2778367 RepID=UPI0019166BC8|nr:prolyl oligopeptidase family serine peptidase [Ktedonobacter sp. SOSP1-85]GHO79534.1 alpha/beta hydrolase [Ktedonobacter sp. SOSP1-85]
MLTLLVCVLLLILLLLVGLCVGLSWYIAHRLLHRTTNASTAFTIPLVDVNAEAITLQSTKNTRRPGVFGIRGPEGQAIVGPILSSDARTVTRKLLQVAGTLTPQTNVAWNTTVYGGKLQEQLHLTIDEVSVPTPLGAMPAWFVPGQQPIWVILVHGTTGTQEQGLRAFQTLANLGFPILDITYRNDTNAPASTDGLSHLGETEWEDVEASVKYALTQGAQSILLYGISMGGTMVEVFLARSSYADHIHAVILDSPVLDWRATIESQTRKNKLPSFIARGAEVIISRRTHINFEALNLLTQPPRHIPTLLFHGMDDTSAPIALSDIFASIHPSITYVRVPDAEHTQCWNANAQEYESQLRTFIEETVLKG